MPRLVLALLPLLAACEEAVRCSVEARPSALVHVVDPSGNPVVATVLAVDADGNEVFVGCAEGGDAATCTTWSVGVEDAGAITVSASVYDGCNDGTGSVVLDVPLDEVGCHVVTQEAQLVIEAWTDLDCG